MNKNNNQLVASNKSNKLFEIAALTLSAAACNVIWSPHSPDLPSIRIR